MIRSDRKEFSESDLTPAYLSEEERSLYAEAILGKDAVDFLNSDLGRVIRGYAIQNIDEVKEALLTTPVWRKRKIQQLQFKAAVAAQFMQFIQEAISRGEMAVQSLNQLRD